MTNDNNKKFTSALRDRFIPIFLYGLLILILITGVYLDITNRRPYSLVCFLKCWKNDFFAATICVWGFTLTSAIFLLGRLNEVYYGTSLKRLIIMSFGKELLVAYVILYILLIPGIVITYYHHLWLTNGVLQITNYLFSAGLIVFIMFISVRLTVIYLIRKITLERINDSDLIGKPFMDEQLPILNMIRGLDYNDMWQISKLQGIILDVIQTEICNDQIYTIYNIITLLIQNSGYKKEKEKNCTINILKEIISRTIDFCGNNDIKMATIEAAVVGIIFPLLQVRTSAGKGKWISQLISILPWHMQKEICVILLFGAEYLNECEVFCKITVNELLEVYLMLNKIRIAPKEKYGELLDKMGNYWLTWNRLNFQEMRNPKIYEAFTKDYLYIDERVCTGKILLMLQGRILENEYY